MFPLRVRRTDVGHDGAAELDEVTIWRDRDDAPAAVCFERADQRWITLPGIGSFRFGREPGPVEGFVSPEVPGESVLERYHRVVLPIVCQAFGHEALHASAVAMPAGVVAFCGSSGAGKSTLACGLGIRGHAVVADDAFVVSFKPDPITAAAIPFELRLLADTRRELRVGERGRSPATDAGSVRRPLRALAVLERTDAPEPGAGDVADRVAPAEAFRLLLRHALCFSVHDRRRTATMVRNYMRLAAEVPTYRLALRTRTEHLPAILDRLELLWG